MSQHPSVLAINAYKEANPDVDFEGQIIRLARNADGTYTATGHSPTTPEIEAAFNHCCCHPDLPRGHERRETT